MQVAVLSHYNSKSLHRETVHCEGVCSCIFHLAVYLLAETQHLTPTPLRSRSLFGSQSVEVSVGGWLAPGQGGMAEGHHRGETVHSMVDRKQRETKGGGRPCDTPPGSVSSQSTREYHPLIQSPAKAPAVSVRSFGELSGWNPNSWLLAS